jgi:hypothetical protein
MEVSGSYEGHGTAGGEVVSFCGLSIWQQGLALLIHLPPEKRISVAGWHVAGHFSNY